MDLFFAWRGRQREFVWREDDGGGRWKMVPLGFFAERVVAAVLTGDRSRLAAMVEEAEREGAADAMRPLLALAKIGPDRLDFPPGPEKGEKEIVAAVWPVLALAGVKTQQLEGLGFFPQDDWVSHAAGYLTGSDKGLWYLWPEIWPFFRKGNRLGWLVQTGSVLRAAAAEVVFCLQCGAKMFKFCPQCHQAYFYHDEGCPRCQVAKEMRERFLGLLRKHKHEVARRMKDPSRKREKAERLSWAAREIEDLQNKLRDKPLTEEIILHYAQVCKSAGLPTRWMEKYRP